MTRCGHRTASAFIRIVSRSCADPGAGRSPLARSIKSTLSRLSFAQSFGNAMSNYFDARECGPQYARGQKRKRLRYRLEGRTFYIWALGRLRRYRSFCSGKLRLSGYRRDFVLRVRLHANRTGQCNRCHKRRRIQSDEAVAGPRGTCVSINDGGSKSGTGKKQSGKARLCTVKHRP